MCIQTLEKLQGGWVKRFLGNIDQRSLKMGMLFHLLALRKLCKIILTNRFSGFMSLWTILRLCKYLMALARLNSIQLASPSVYRLEEMMASKRSPPWRKSVESVSATVQGSCYWVSDMYTWSFYKNTTQWKYNFCSAIAFVLIMFKQVIPWPTPLQDIAHCGCPSPQLKARCWDASHVEGLTLHSGSCAPGNEGIPVKRKYKHDAWWKSFRCKQISYRVIQDWSAYLIIISGWIWETNQFKLK